MLLLELREILDRYAHYGHWIGPNNEVHPVGGEQHRTWLRMNLLPKLDPQVSKQDNLYSLAFKLGFVRLEHQDPGTLSVEGFAKDLTRAYRILRQSFAQDDLDAVRVDVIPDRGASRDYRIFYLPNDKSKLMSFFTSLAGD